MIPVNLGFGDTAEWTPSRTAPRGEHRRTIADMQPSMDAPIVRPAARVILLDPENRILLIRAQLSRSNVLWLTPGGGLEPGEDHARAAKRELFEETGLRDVELSRCVWERSHIFVWAGTVYDARERYFLAHLAAEAEITAEHRTEEERALLQEHRWWTIAEIERSEETFVPRGLAGLLVPLLLGNYPEEPLSIGV